MRLFWRKKGENERNKEDSRTDEVQSTTNGVRSRSSEVKTRSSDADLMCEEAIMKDKERFGRVRNSLMKHLRIEYGNDVADRALQRINKRWTEGYFNQ